MDVQALLGEFPAARFVAEHYQRLPYSAAGQAGPLAALGTWETLTAILAQEASDVLVCKRNEQWEGKLPRSAEEAGVLVERGFTLLVRHAERHDRRLAEVAAAFQRDFAAGVNIHLYCTPAAEYGFGWHYDAEEVFLVQTQGRKEYSLRKNTVNPWPLEEALPADMRYEREIMPLVRCELAAGDWLYIPSGYWHMGRSRETSITLAIGIQARSAVEVLDFLRPQLVHSMFWRQRLPVAGRACGRSADELRADYERLLKSCGGELQRLLSDSQQAEAFLSWLNPTNGVPQP